MAAETKGEAKDVTKEAKDGPVLGLDDGPVEEEDIKLVILFFIGHSFIFQHHHHIISYHHITISSSITPHVCMCLLWWNGCWTIIMCNGHHVVLQR
jgi:hypothetical protein